MIFVWVAPSATCFGVFYEFGRGLMHLMPRSLVVLVLLGLMAACGPSTSSTPGAGQVDGGGQAAQRSSAPKVLTVVGREAVIGNFPGVTGGGGGRNYFVLDYLTATDPHEDEVPRLAQEVISVENGTWTINPDGTMDTIWKLRPNVKWH